MTKPFTVDLTQHIDDRGTLFEAWRQSWDAMPDIKQVYMVHNPVRDTVRAFHRHEFLWDGFCIVHGSAKFHLFTGEMGKYKSTLIGRGEEYECVRVEDKDIITVTLRASKPQLLIVPPPFWHGWASLEDDTLLMSIASHEYNAEEPDEERINPWDEFEVMTQGHSHGDYVEWGPEAK